MRRKTAWLLTVATAVLGCSGGIADQEQANIAVVQRWYDEVWSQGDLSVVDEIVSEDYVKHWAAFPPWVGKDELKAQISEWRNSFPDWKEDIDAIHASGDLVFVRWTESGTFSVDLPESNFF